MRKVLITAVLLGLCLAILIVTAGCGAPTKEVKIDLDDDGRQIELKQGQTLVVTLETQGGIPYTWQIAERDEAILQGSSEPEYEVLEKMPGGRVNAIFRFVAQNAGSTPLKIELRTLPQIEPVEVAKTFSVTVVVR